MPSTTPPTRHSDAPSRRLLSVNTGAARRLQTEGHSVLSAIGKRAVVGPVAVGRMGLAGDEQADLSVHGGLQKAVYAYPVEHYAFWQAQRREHGVSLFDEDLPAGFVGENLTLSGLLEADVWVGDELHFANCTLRVTAPREPCFKFNAVMGFNRAAKAMAEAGCCGFYLAVDTPGTLTAGEAFRLVPGPRRLGIPEAFAAKRAKHLR
jgi:MOSC domain-containing protein YiiM